MFGKGKLAMDEGDNGADDEGESDKEKSLDESDPEEIDFDRKRAERLMEKLGISGSYDDLKKLIDICTEG